MPEDRLTSVGATSYLIMVMAALGLGLAVPAFFRGVAVHASWLLAGIFFLSALHIDLRDLAGVARKPMLVLVHAILMLVVFPVVVFYLAELLAPEMRVALLILAAMPAGMTSPLLAKMSGGDEGLALVLTVVTSLVAPLTVPLVLLVLLDVAVQISFWEMAGSLATVILVPFVLAQVVRAGGWYRRRNRVGRQFLSVGLLLVLIAGIAAKQAVVIRQGFVSGDIWQYLVVLTGFFVVFHVAGYLLSWWESKERRVAVVVCLAYMNFTLAIVLADRFFGNAEVVTPTVLAVIPWALLLPVFRRFFAV